MSWRNASLVDVEYTFNVDTSKLEERLDEIEAKLDQDGTIEEKVAEAIDNRDLQTADDVRNYIDGLNLPDNDHTHEEVDEDRVKDIVRDMMHSEGEDFVQGIIDNNDYVTAEDVAQQIRDADFVDEGRVNDLIEEALDNAEYTTAQDVRDILTEEGLDSNGVADAEDVDKLKDRVTDLERRFEMYASRVDDLMQSTREVSERQANRIMEIERKNQTALDFFGLIEQAFNLLRRGA
jgi:tetrahydromethanopterin S-methyltransferase subunit G